MSTKRIVTTVILSIVAFVAMFAACNPVPALKIVGEIEWEARQLTAPTRDPVPANQTEPVKVIAIEAPALPPAPSKE